MANMPGQGVDRTGWAILDRIIGQDKGMRYTF